MEDILGAVPGMLTGAMQTQVGQFTVAFGLAAWIHSGRMKKEIKAQGQHFVDAVNNLTMALTTRIDKVEDRVQSLEQKKP